MSSIRRTIAATITSLRAVMVAASRILSQPYEDGDDSDRPTPIGKW